ncbi:MAG: lipoyl synthase [Deltaproteobacteria bacterium]|nr:lipoyl synthase [Deltaproteobacteria bacterium]
MATTKRKPDWLKIRLPGGERYRHVRQAVNSGGLHTVCEEARCPNMGECWESGSATFMILGDICTRGCRFCAVSRGAPEGASEPDEPTRMAEAVRQMGLDYAVVTSVTRDDLPDGGASVFAQVVRAVKKLSPPPLVELLIPDLSSEALDRVVESGAEVIAHNIEVVERLTPILRHAKFSYEKSLGVLEAIKRSDRKVLTKSSILLGLGETDEEIETTMRDLRAVEVDILVLGQYLRPTRANARVVEYVSPERFDALASRGEALGFGFVAAGPLVRTSYRAAEAYARHTVAKN